MAVPVIMPRQGQSVESCIITKWHKVKGDKVKEGELLFSYETDKASFDEEAKISGTVLDILFQEGDDVPVLNNVCIIGAEGEDIGAAEQPGSIAAEAVAAGTGGSAGIKSAVLADSSLNEMNIENKKTADIKNIQTSDIKNIQTSDIEKIQTADVERLKISPRARNLAGKMGMDFRYANPTGPGGRIIERDIIKLRENGPVVSAFLNAENTIPAETRQVGGTGIGGRITAADIRTAAANQEGVEGKQVAGVPGKPAVTQTVIPPVSHSGIQPGVQSGAETGFQPGAQSEDKTEVKPEAWIGASAATYDEIKLPNIRKVIAKAMQNSLSTTAQLTLNTSFDATRVLELRKLLKDNKELLKLQNITLNDMILYAVSRTILNHKSLNAHFLDDRMLVFRNVHLGIAVDTERGLMVPTVTDANLKSLNEISAEVKKLAEQCQSGTIKPDLLKGASFTVTNLGTLGIESFTPVLNPPQTGILGVCSIIQRTREVNGIYTNYPAMGLSLTFDHRALDGAPAARFLKALATVLENFDVLLAW